MRHRCSTLSHQSFANRKPAGSQQETRRNWQDASRTPTGNQQETGRKPSGNQQETSKKLAGRQQETSRKFAGRQQQASRKLAGRQQETNRKPEGNWQDANRKPAGFLFFSPWFRALLLYSRLTEKHFIILLYVVLCGRLMVMRGFMNAWFPPSRLRKSIICS